MRPRSLRGVAVTLLAAALLSACTSSPPEDGGAVAPSDYGGRFVYPLRTEPATLNFVTARDQPADPVSRVVGDPPLDRGSHMETLSRLGGALACSHSGPVLNSSLPAGVRLC